MSQVTVSTSLTPEVTIEEILGSLQVKGWDRAEILAKTEGEETPTVEEQDDNVTIRCLGDCLVRLPHGASLKVSSVKGEASIKLLDEKLVMEQVMGSLILRNVPETRIDIVHGELVAKQVLGDLHVDHVSGNAVVRDVQGYCTIERVSGNLDLRDAEGDLIISAGGNVRVRLSILSGDRYDVTADGGLTFRMPSDTSAQLNLSSQANQISLRLPGEKKVIKEGTYSTSLGEAGATINLSSGGSLSVEGQETGWFERDEIEAEIESAFMGLSEGFNEGIAEQVESQLEAHMQMLDEQMSRLAERLDESGLSEEQLERIKERTRARSEQAMARATEKMRRTEEKIARKMAAAQRKAELKARAAERQTRRHGRRTWSFEWPPSPQAPSPHKEPVAEEERLMILRMLEQKKITLEEAESLLSALEGKS